jgi:acid phosphatase family membrane protein YuiD
MVSSYHTVSLRAFFENPVILSSVTSWFFAQLVKALVVMLGARKRSARDIFETLTWRTGGMPSSHAAVVGAMTAAAAFRDGLDSSIFGVSFLMALIVMRDAMGVRRASGVHARSLNILGRFLAEKLGLEYHPVKEVKGHSPLEVIVGAFLGIFIAAAYVWL